MEGKGAVHHHLQAVQVVQQDEAGDLGGPPPGVDTPEGILIDRPLTSAQLASLLGIWQGEIQTLLARLQFEGILLVTGDRMTVARPDRLAGR